MSNPSDFSNSSTSRNAAADAPARPFHCAICS